MIYMMYLRKQNAILLFVPAEQKTNQQQILTFIRMTATRDCFAAARNDGKTARDCSIAALLAMTM